MSSSKEAQNLRSIIVLLRVVLGIVLLATWWENINKGLYQPDSFANFINWLADGHPIAWYGNFLTGVIAPNAAIFGAFQLITELGMGLALLVGVFTPPAAFGATFFFLNLFMAYTIPTPGNGFGRMFCW